jgi:hypothetical protein
VSLPRRATALLSLDSRHMAPGRGQINRGCSCVNGIVGCCGWNVNPLHPGNCISIIAAGQLLIGNCLSATDRTLRMTRRQCELTRVNRGSGRRVLSVWPATGHLMTPVKYKMPNTEYPLDEYRMPISCARLRERGKSAG